MSTQIELIPRPEIGHCYTPGDDDICEMRAIGPTHVVVVWLVRHSERRCIYTRADFSERFTEVMCPAPPGVQPDLFGELLEAPQP
jgi:hypothetical protein